MLARCSALFFSVLLAACSGGGGGASSSPSAPVYRAGVRPLYFGALDSDAAEIATETGAIWTNGWGPEGFIPHATRQLLAAQQVGANFAVLLLDTSLQQDGGERARLRGIFDALRAAGVLSMVKWGFVVDEPEQQGFSAAMVAAGVAHIRAVAAEYPELTGLQLLINYGCANEFVGVESADIVSCDRYDHSAAETLLDLQEKAQGKPIMEFAGGVEPYLADPAPYVTEAMNNQQIIALGYFIHMDNAGAGLGRGIGNPLNSRHLDYCSASATLRNARLTTC